MITRIWAALKAVRSMVVLGFLVLALSALNFVMGCEDEDAAPMYGPQPDTLGNDTDNSDLVVTDVVDEQPRVYYGPALLDVDAQDVVGEVDDPSDSASDTEFDFPRTYYGPMPVDAVDDSVDVVSDAVVEDAPIAWYGPPPPDLTPSTDAVDDVAKDAADVTEVAAYYGPIPLYGAQSAE